MAAATVALKNTGPYIAMFMIVILSMIVTGHAWMWVRWNWQSNEKNIRSAFYYAEHAQKILLGSNASEPSEDKRQLTRREQYGFGFFDAGPCRFQIAATSLLDIVLAVYLVSGTSLPTPQLTEQSQSEASGSFWQLLWDSGPRLHSPAQNPATTFTRP
jgi:hypothetical protein